MNGKPLYFVLSGPSGAGKTSIAKRLKEKMPDVGCPVSHTSRAPRETEAEGVDYYFVSSEAMTCMETYKELIECSTKKDGAMYGLSKYELRRMRRYSSVVMNLDTSGGLALREQLGENVILIMVTSEYGDELYSRLRSRGTEDEKEIARRMGNAVVELSVCRQYDYVIVNRDVDESVTQLMAIIQAEHLRTARQSEKVMDVLDDLAGKVC